MKFIIQEQSQHTQTDDYDPKIREHENRKTIENSFDIPQSDNEANDQTQNGQKESNNIDASKKNEEIAEHVWQ